MMEAACLIFLIPEMMPSPQINLWLNFCFSGLVIFHCFFCVLWTVCTALCAICDSMNANKRKLKEI